MKVHRTELTPKALQAQLNKHFGAGTVLFADDPSLAIERIPSGILSLDYILNGGWARGRHSEMYGGFSLGKTFISLHTIANAQSEGLRCAFVDAENTFDPRFAKHLGVNLKQLVLQPQHEHGHQLIDVMEALLRSRLYDVIVLDSIAALLPKAERESEISASDMGTYQARLMSKALRKLTTANTDTVLLYINQQRESVGSLFGPRMVTSGGRAMSFYAGTRLELTKAEDIKVNIKIIDPKTSKSVVKSVVEGHRVLVRIAKDKSGSKPFDETTFVFSYKLSSIDPIEDLIYLGRRLGYIHASGGDIPKFWVGGYEDEKQSGRTRFKAWLIRNVAVAEELEENIRNHDEDQDSNPDQ